MSEPIRRSTYRQMAPEEAERHRDATWAQHDAQVILQFGGQWVVAFEREVISHGVDATDVLEEAKRKLAGRCQIEYLLVAAVPANVNWAADA